MLAELDDPVAVPLRERSWHWRKCKYHVSGNEHLVLPPSYRPDLPEWKVFIYNLVLIGLPIIMLLVRFEWWMPGALLAWILVLAPMMLRTGARS